eukprot:TRINITY_DN20557_c0_g1_i1.p1 TRINITY_DN20557_c0_g1~~TRINITY_DN20557_c0_g1_i1.p1  ORF type:complete len:396 (-),score=38.42 TRINITY_DN20557_c0_g1_i1:392-1579(-)
MTKTNLHQFPPHMRKAFKAVKELVGRVDLVFEMRDARIPFSSRNRELEALTSDRKKRIVILNKADLIHKRDQIESLRWMASQKEEAHLICSRDQESVAKLMKDCLEELKSKKAKDDILLAMIIGVPNCGKSSLINAMRAEAKQQGLLEERKSKQRVVTGPLPGVTRALSSFQISKGPPAIFMLDTPGIMVPKITSTELACKLAMTRAISEQNFGMEALARFFILQLLKGRQKIKFKPNPHHNIQRTREDRKIAYNLDFSTRRYHGIRGIGEEQVNDVFYDVIGNFYGSSQDNISQEDVIRVCWRIITGVREGSFGRYMFDDLADLQRKKDTRDSTQDQKRKINRALIDSIGEEYFLDKNDQNNKAIAGKQQQEEDERQKEGVDEYGYTQSGLIIP